MTMFILNKFLSYPYEFYYLLKQMQLGMLMRRMLYFYTEN